MLDIESISRAARRGAIDFESLPKRGVTFDDRHRTPDPAAVAAIGRWWPTDGPVAACAAKLR